MAAGVCLAGDAGGGALEALALGSLTLAIWQDGDGDGALRLARQAQAIAEGHAGVLRRGLGEIVAGVLTRPGTWPPPSGPARPHWSLAVRWAIRANLCGVLRDLTILDLRIARIDARPRRATTSAGPRGSGTKPAAAGGADLTRLALSAGLV